MTKSIDEIMICQLLSVLELAMTNSKLSEKLLAHLHESLQNINGWGSIEIIIQDNKVTQITEKNIKKPIISLSDN